MKNFVLSLLLLSVSLAAVFGVCLLVKDYEYRANYITSINSEYAKALENLKKEVDVNIENVTELTKEIELKGLTIDDLTRTVTEYKTEVVVLRETVTQYETIIVEKNNTIASKDKEIQTVTQTVVEYRDRIVYLEKDNSDKESEIESLEGSSAEDKARIAELEAEIEANNREIANLCQEIVDLEAEISEKNATIASLQDEIAQLEASKNEVEVQIVEKETIIVEKEEIIVEKEAEIQQLNINVNVLNQTIIELNVKIELLEEAIEKDASKTYFEEIFDNNNDLTVTLIPSNVKDYFFFVGTANYPGVYKIYTSDYSMEQLNDTITSPDIVKTQSGKYLLIANNYCDNMYLLNPITTELKLLIEDDHIYKSGILEVNEKVVLSRPGHYIDMEEEVAYPVICPETNKVLDTGMASFAVIDENRYLFGSSNPKGYYMYNALDNTTIKVNFDDTTATLSGRVDDCAYYQLSNGNILFCVSLSNIEQYLGIYELDITTNTISRVVSGIYFTNSYSKYITEITEDLIYFSYGQRYYLANMNLNSYVSLNSSMKSWCYYTDDTIFAMTYNMGYLYNMNDGSLVSYNKLTTDGDYVIVSSSTDESLTTLYYDTVNNTISNEQPTKVAVVNNDTIFNNIADGSYVSMPEYGALSLDKTEVYIGKSLTVSMETANYDIKGLYYSISEDVSLDGSNFVKITLDENNSFTVTEDMCFNGSLQLFLIVEGEPYMISLINATTIDESSFEEESISSIYIGQEVELFITVPMGHYPSHFQVLTLDSNGNETWKSFDCNGGMNGMTRFNCSFVLEESLIINNTLTIRYNHFTSL